MLLGQYYYQPAADEPFTVVNADESLEDADNPLERKKIINLKQVKKMLGKRMIRYILPNVIVNLLNKSIFLHLKHKNLVINFYYTYTYKCNLKSLSLMFD